MNVTLRKRQRNNGKLALFLDYYPSIISPKTGKPTRFEYLKIYLYNPPRDEFERKHNKEVENFARAIAAERQLDIIAGRFGLQRSSEYDDFLTFYKQQMEQHLENMNTYGGWMASYKTFSQFVNNQCKFGDLKPKLIDDFKIYLETKATRINSPKMRITSNSAYSYFNKLRACVRQAMALGHIKQNPFDLVKGIAQPETYREFLTKEELIRLANTDCEQAIMRNACIFSSLTGMRLGDIVAMKWEQVQESDSIGNFIRFTQQKTKGLETLPISDEALSLMGPRSEFQSALVFNGFQIRDHYSALQRWLRSAGIRKKITFHNFRHTFATLQLAEGTDIYTVSKLLGHKHIHTTQIYGKVMDKTKTEAIKRINLGLITANKN
jgi:integrase